MDQKLIENRILLTGEQLYAIASQARRLHDTN